MQHKIEALLRFISADLSDNHLQANELLSSERLWVAAKAEKISPVEIKQRIYKTFQEFGYENAKGEFKVLWGID